MTSTVLLHMEICSLCKQALNNPVQPNLSEEHREFVRSVFAQLHSFFSIPENHLEGTTTPSTQTLISWKNCLQKIHELLTNQVSATDRIRTTWLLHSINLGILYTSKKTPAPAVPVLSRELPLSLLPELPPLNHSPPPPPLTFASVAEKAIAQCPPVLHSAALPILTECLENSHGANLILPNKNPGTFSQSLNILIKTLQDPGNLLHIENPDTRLRIENELIGCLLLKTALEKDPNILQKPEANLYLDPDYYQNTSAPPSSSITYSFSHFFALTCASTQALARQNPSLPKEEKSILVRNIQLIKLLFLTICDNNPTTFHPTSSWNLSVALNILEFCVKLLADDSRSLEIKKFLLESLLNPCKKIDQRFKPPPRPTPAVAAAAAEPPLTTLLFATPPIPNDLPSSRDGTHPPQIPDFLPSLESLNSPGLPSIEDLFQTRGDPPPQASQVTTPHPNGMRSTSQEDFAPPPQRVRFPTPPIL